jgi:hypothetical protein
MKLTMLTMAALIAMPIILAPRIAMAQPGMTGSYVGAGVAGGVTNGGRGNDDAVFGGNIQGRFAIPDAPLSVRGAVLFGGKTSAIIPTLTYDAPIGQNTNLYVGGGYSFVGDDGDRTQIGNRDAAVITAGVESEVAKSVVVYGDAKWGINAYENSSADALTLQGGVGIRF